MEKEMDMRDDLTDRKVRKIMEIGKAIAALAGSQVTDPYLDKLIADCISGKITNAQADRAALEWIINGRKIYEG